MAESSAFPNGTYRVVNKDGLYLRGTPSTQHNGNIIKFNGSWLKLTIGKTFHVYGLAEDLRKNGWVWAIITVPDMLIKQTIYVCLHNLNTQFAELVLADRRQDVVNPDWVQAVDEYLRSTRVPLPPPFI